MSYRELRPPAELRPWVECAWEVESDGAQRRILPDGCIDVVWTGKQLQLVGANTAAFTVATATGQIATGVRFHPGGAPAALSLDAEAVLDARVPVAEAWGDEGRRLEERFAADPSVEVLFEWVRRRSAGRTHPDPLVRAVMWAPGRRTGALSRDLHVSERTLRRRVTAAVGYGPKRLSRVLRLQRALAAARAGQELAAAGALGGYADQSHFANDCVALAGVSPSQLI